MKKIFFLTTVVCILFLTGCRSVINDPIRLDFSSTHKSNDKYKMSNISDGSFYVGENTLAVFPYADKLYVAGEELGYYDIANDMAYTGLCPLPPCEDCDIFADDSGVYYADGSSILHILSDGTIAAEYQLNYDTIDYAKIQVCADEDFIIACGETVSKQGDYVFRIITVDRKNGALAEGFSESRGYNSQVMMLEPTEKPGEFIMVRTRHPDNFLAGLDAPIFAVYTFHAGNGELTHEYDFDYSISGVDYIPSDETFYGLTETSFVKNEGSFRFSAAGFGDTSFRGYLSFGASDTFSHVKNALSAVKIEAKPMEMNNHPYHFFTGSDYICFDTANKTVNFFSCDVSEGGESLVILYPSGNYSAGENIGNRLDSTVFNANMRFEDEYNVTTETLTYNIDEFSDRLRMKLLAGESDYDVVYLDGAGELFPHILRYGLYLPLEGYEEIVSSYGNYIPGVKDIMSFNGHIYGVPYTLGGWSLIVREAYHTLGLPDFPTSPTFEDFWELCERMQNEQSGKPLAMQYHMYLMMMNSLIEDGAEKGKMDASAVLNTLNKLLYYIDAGVLTTYSDNFLLKHTYTFSTEGVVFADYELSFCEMSPFPSINGKHYYIVESMIYANSKTQNAETAVNYLSMLMREEFAAEALTGKSNLWKNTDDYFRYKDYGFDESQLVEDGYNVPKIPAERSLYDVFLIENAGASLMNAAPALYSSGMDEFLDEVFEGLLDGSMTAEKASREICREVDYRILE